MPVQPGVLNPFGIVHAGAMLWFADVCATILASGKTEFVPGAAGFPLGVSLNANFTGRFSSRGNAEFQDKLLSAMRYEFGGHLEKSAK